jgi:catechol 2,3-dioxygenase-like lactoylglutathione lyase family enzyme
MFNVSKAFSSFSVDDIQKAKEFYGKTLGLELASGPEGTLVVPLSGSTKVLMYPKPNHQPATFTVLNFPVDSVENAVDKLSQWTCPHFWHKKLRLKIHRMENLSHGVVAPEVHEGVQDCRTAAARCGCFDRSSGAIV